MDNDFICKSLQGALRHARHAFIKDGKIFINDIVILHDASLYSDISLTVGGMPIDMSNNPVWHAHACNIIRRVNKIESRRNRIRSAIQSFSDKVTHNCRVDGLSDQEIMARIAIDNLAHALRRPMNTTITFNPDTISTLRTTSNRVVITRVGYMHKICLGNIAFCHIPAEPDARCFVLEIGDMVINISKKINQSLYTSAEILFFDVYSKHILSNMLRMAHRRQKSL